MLPSRSLRILSVLLGFAAPTIAQQYNVKNIVFNGTMPYSQAALEAASGLKAGDTITKENLQAASQRLIDTGAFGDLQSSLDGPQNAISVIFKVKPADPSRVLTASFDNIVWYEPAELASELQKIVPLFNGTVPEAGNQQDAIAAALKTLLSSKGVTGGKLSVNPVAPSPSQPMRLLDFRLDSPDVRIHSLKLVGIRPGFAAAGDKLVQQLTGKRYNEGLTPSSLPNTLLSVYKNAGFQASSVSALTRTIASSSPTQTQVDVSVTIQEGDVYHLSRLEWAGSPMMSSEGFSADAGLHPGEVASQMLLLQSLAKLEAAYRNKGYMDVVVTATPHLEKVTHLVAFTIAAVPGQPYTLHQVTPVNLSDSQKGRLREGLEASPRRHLR